MTNINYLRSIKLIALITITVLNLAWGSDIDHVRPLQYRIERQKIIQEQIDSRWAKLKKAKEGGFAFYENKSDDEITSEFQRLHDLRNKLWYLNREKIPYISNPDYEFYIPLNTSSYANNNRPKLAFAYNWADDFYYEYNASSILLYGYHFLALSEPIRENLNAFFRVLMNHNASVLVRLKPEGEYNERGSFNYWEGKIFDDLEYPLIEPSITDEQGIHKGTAIPYCYINTWDDDADIAMHDLFSLVQKVRRIYRKTSMDGPIACHCAAGVGRTGTFIAAYVLAEMLDIFKPEDISIEEIVLKLSIQRPEMVFNEEQYLVLYGFVNYYMNMKNYWEERDL